MNCSNCGKTAVDPYIEREWLLVAIDCILLRDEAYRHVLFNVDELKEVPTRRCLQFLFAWSLLDAYLKWETLRNDKSSDEAVLQDTTFLLSLGVSSFFGMLAQWLAICTYRYMKAVSTNKTQPNLIWTKLFWALLLPSTFSVVTISVIIWENTKTVRLLASLLIAYWQGIAVSVISGDISTAVVGIVAGTLWRLGVSLWMQPYICVGLEVDVSLSGIPTLCIT
jgi:hypothetical protein